MLCHQNKTTFGRANKEHRKPNYDWRGKTIEKLLGKYEAKLGELAKPDLALLLGGIITLSTK
jgi:hypothetical protein